MRPWAWAIPGFFFLLGLGFLAFAYVDPLLDRVSSGVARDEVKLTFTIMGLSFAGTALLVGGIYALVARTAASARRLQQTGRRATAVVIDVEDTGVTINDNPRVRLKLRVHPEDGHEFEVDAKKVVSRLTIPRPGMVIAIRYDPADPENFVFDEGGGAAGMPAADQVEAMVRQALTAKGVTGLRQEDAVRDALAQLESGHQSIDLRHYTRPETTDAPPEPAVDPLDRLKKLAELRDSGVLTETEFELQKAKILAGL